MKSAIAPGTDKPEAPHVAVGEKARESLLPSDEQKAIKTNYCRTVGWTSLSCFPSRRPDKTSEGFLENLFFSMDGSKATKISRRCLNELEQVTHIKMTILFLYFLCQDDKQQTLWFFSKTSLEGSGFVPIK